MSERCHTRSAKRKEVTTHKYFELATKVKEITDRFRIPLIIDDRIDICQAVDAAGVHIGDNDLPISVARRLIGPEKFWVCLLKVS